MTSIPLSKSLLVFLSFLLLTYTTYGFFLSPNFYSTTCPRLRHIVRATMKEAIKKNPNMGAAMIRLFFHDCFVNGCDASVLLDDTLILLGEKNAPPNKNSLRGFEVIDAIKAKVEASCPATVSCADILALAAQDSVAMLHGPRWQVPLGRRDSTTASMVAAVANLPPSNANLAILIGYFAAKGLTPRDMVALSGAHTVGRTRCSVYRDRVYNEPNIAPEFAAKHRTACPAAGGDDAWAPLDEKTPNRFDNRYFGNLVAGRGLLHSDQELFSGQMMDALVRHYSNNNTAFAKDFAAAMVKMGNLMPLIGGLGEIRLNCRKVNF